MRAAIKAPGESTHARGYAPRQRLALLAFVAALAVPATASAGALDIRLDGCPCPNRDRIARRIAQDLEPRLASKPDAALSLTRAPPGSLHVAFEFDGGVYESEIAFSPRDCPALADTIVLLASSWLESATTAPPPAPEPPPPAPPPVDLPAAPAAPAVPPREPHRWAFGLALGAGVDAGPVRSPKLALGPDVEWALARGFAVGVGARWRQSTTVDAADGRVRIASLAAAAYARGRVALGADVALDLFAGPAVQRLELDASGFDRNFAHRYTDPAALAGLRLLGAVSPTVRVGAALEALVRFRRDHLEVGQTTGSVDVGPAQLRAAIEVLYEPF